MKLALLIGSTTVAATLLATYGPGERVLAALGLGPAPQHYLGYVEGESTLVAPPIAGRLGARLVERGGRGDDRTEPGQPGAGEEPPVRPDAGGARGGAGREHVLQCGRVGIGGFSGGIAAART